MPQISERTLSKVRETVCIVDLVSSYVELKQRGRNLVGLSPFNNEKTPSFNVDPVKNLFYCFSSGKGGDGIAFIRELLNLSFTEAVEYIAKEFDITIEYAGENSEFSASLRKELFKIHECAASYFHSNLLAGNAEATTVRNYWIEDRGFSMSEAKAYRIGFLPANGDGLLDMLSRQRFSDEAIQQSGLFFYDRLRNVLNGSRFRGRLILPIRDIQGRIVAFSGRHIPVSDQGCAYARAKYINSPETPIFKKKHLLFGIDTLSKCLRKSSSEVILVEGQFDAIRCWQAGLDITVASLGTALTEGQVKLLSRSKPLRVICLLDGDGAASKAALRNLSLFLSVGVEVRFVMLPEGSDPDSFILNNGKGALEELLKQSVSEMEFAVSQFLPAAQAHTAHLKRGAFIDTFELLLACDYLCVQDAFLEELSHLVEIDKHIIKTDFERYKNSIRS